MLGRRTHLETLDRQAFDKVVLKVIGTRKNILGGLGVIHHQISQKIRIRPKMLKVEVRMLALYVEGFIEISSVSLKEKVVIIVGRQDTYLEAVHLLNKTQWHNLERMIKEGKHKGKCLHSHHKTFKFWILWLQVSSHYSQTLLKLYLILDVHTLSSPLDMLCYVIRNLDLWIMTCLWPHL